MPVNISLPDGKVLSELPTRYRKLALNIPRTSVQFISSRWGVFINQSVEIAGHVYREQYVEVTSSDLSLTLSSTTPVIFLQVSLNSTHLCMRYLGPDVSIPLHLSANKIYHTIYIEPSVSLLSQLLSTYSMLSELMTAFSGLYKSTLELPYSKYSGTVRVELDKIKNNLLTGDARTKYYDNRIADFTIAYLDGVHRRSFQDSRLIALFDTEILSLIHKIESSPELLFNIEDLAKNMGITERALQNGFRLKTGLTVLQYVQQLRMSKAKTLLIRSELPIADIGLEVGYSDSSFFIRVFKKSTGVAPGRYRSTFSEV
ncbi:Helix-turn-helix domain-containing protein [Chitinophaga sp. YR573]|uniref:helix-turn-helix domain-containing protein n=1 Tax=Chitinophaga sp. YR573 TaxID=1881040 RepID=UPI0008B01E3B|nr:helix-turn-helix transcriptional regulator [Chitinophaga sp. YR573]SEW37145.1 Helix-turn-helix domain-containing protein [Chitinophaga sp. YR573]